MQNKAWQISLKELKENVADNVKAIRKNTVFIFYPVFLLYAFTIIALAKFIQITF